MKDVLLAVGYFYLMSLLLSVPLVALVALAAWGLHDVQVHFLDYVSAMGDAWRGR